MSRDDAEIEMADRDGVEIEMAVRPGRGEYIQAATMVPKAASMGTSVRHGSSL